VEIFGIFYGHLVGIFYGHLVFLRAFGIVFPFWKNLATLLDIHFVFKIFWVILGFRNIMLARGHGEVIFSSYCDGSCNRDVHVM
jgi:hypothetical protein